jgi:hypothetical protein
MDYLDLLLLIQAVFCKRIPNHQAQWPRRYNPLVANVPLRGQGTTTPQF